MNTSAKYNSILTVKETIETVQEIKTIFELNLIETLHLNPITAPQIVSSDLGLNDDSDGTVNAVKFRANDLPNAQLEMVRSLAKWKRKFLADAVYKVGQGIISSVAGIRPDEKLSNIHSLQADQWDWELVISEQERNLAFLKNTVNKIFAVFLETEKKVAKIHPQIHPVLPREIKFIHAEELLAEFPELNAQERENRAAKKYGAIFIIGIGCRLSNDEIHGKRAADYDDWSTLNSDGFFGLNGDIIFWNPVLNQSLEISSLGIRVNKMALIKQLETTKSTCKLNLHWHKQLMNNEFPLTIGGGIGQSRLCMFLLRKAHIGEVQPSVWPQEMLEECKLNKINLL